MKKAEHRRIDAFELWCLIRLLRVPWVARRSNQSILKEISPECSLEGLILKLKLQYSGHLMPSSHLILCHPLLLLSIFPSIRVKRVSSSHQVAKVLEFSFNISPSNEYSGLLSFRMDWLDPLLLIGMSHCSPWVSLPCCKKKFTLLTRNIPNGILLKGINTGYRSRHFHH